MSVPRVKRMNKKSRLAHARSTGWASKNKGAKSIVRRYRKYFGVDLVAAALELRALGVKITETRFAEIQCSATSSPKALRKKAAREREAEEQELDRCWPVWRDEPFPFPVDEHEVMDMCNGGPAHVHEAGPQTDLWEGAIWLAAVCEDNPF